VFGGWRVSARGRGSSSRTSLLREDNVRTGFFERDQFETVHRHLPVYAKRVALFAYITGWRLRSEVLPLTWAQVDFTAGIVRLEVGATKNREGRTFVMPPALRACLDRRAPAGARVPHPVGFPPDTHESPPEDPPTGRPDQGVPPSLAHCVPRRRSARPHSPRLPP
jgi:integrase